MRTIIFLLVAIFTLAVSGLGLEARLDIEIEEGQGQQTVRQRLGKGKGRGKGRGSRYRKPEEGECEEVDEMIKGTKWNRKCQCKEFTVYKCDG